MFYLTDARDQLRARYDGSNTLDDDIRYDPWGNLLEHGGNAPSALTQGWGVDAAYSQDGDTGLTLMGNRYYDPNLGRFLSEDHAKSGNNWYAYVDNNPLSAEDPTGLTCTDFDSTGMSDDAIDRHIANNGGLPGETYNTVDQTTGLVVHTYTVPNANVVTISGMSVLFPPFASLNQNISRARSARASLSAEFPGNNYLSRLLRRRAIDLWAISAIGPKMSEDYKKYDRPAFEKAGNINAGYVAAALGYTLSDYLNLVQGLHGVMNPNTGPESTADTTLGWNNYVAKYGFVSSSP